MVAVAGGLLAVGGVDAYEAAPPDELFDEASGRWFALPHPMAEPRRLAAVLVSLPAAALAVQTGASTGAASSIKN